MHSMRHSVRLFPATWTLLVINHEDFKFPQSIEWVDFSIIITQEYDMEEMKKENNAKFNID